MAPRQNNVSDAVLMSFMSEMREDRKKSQEEATEIRGLIAKNSSNILLLDSELKTHIKNQITADQLATEYDRKVMRLYVAIGLILTIMLAALGYIWGNNDHNNGKSQGVQTETKVSYKRDEGI